jgi:thiamine-phosphate pyrophosphorylase
VQQAIEGGARLIQYRDKSRDSAKRVTEAAGLLAVCRSAGIALLINDDVELAAALGADGVHLGRDDSDPREARRQLGPSAIIGVSCYDRFERAARAQEEGADYAAFGRFFPSATKPHAVPAGIDLLHRARRELRLPLVAIGGVTPENGASLVRAGADMLAVVEGVFGQPDIRSAALAYRRLFSTEASPDDPLP